MPFATDSSRTFSVLRLCPDAQRHEPSNGDLQWVRQVPDLPWSSSLGIEALYTSPWKRVGNTHDHRETGVLDRRWPTGLRVLVL